jgi:hypothetical protein
VRSMQCNRAFFSRPRKTQAPGDSAWSGLGGEEPKCILEGTSPAPSLPHQYHEQDTPVSMPRNRSSWTDPMFSK